MALIGAGGSRLLHMCSASSELLLKISRAWFKAGLAACNTSTAGNAAAAAAGLNHISGQSIQVSKPVHVLLP